MLLPLSQCKAQIQLVLQTCAYDTIMMQMVPGCHSLEGRPSHYTTAWWSMRMFPTAAIDCPTDMLWPQRDIGQAFQSHEHVQEILYSRSNIQRRCQYWDAGDHSCGGPRSLALESTPNRGQCVSGLNHSVKTSHHNAQSGLLGPSFQQSGDTSSKADMTGCTA